MAKHKTMEKQTSQHSQYLGETVYGILKPVKARDVIKLKMLLKESDNDLVEAGKQSWKIYVQKLP